MGVLPNIFHVCLQRKFQQASQSNVQAYKHNLAKIETGLNRLPVALEPLEVATKLGLLRTRLYTVARGLASRNCY